MQSSPNYEETTYIPIRTASIITGLNEQTLRKLHETFILDGYRTPAKQRMFSRKSIQEFCNMSIGTEKEQTTQRVNILYSRVSSRKQQDDLVRQVDFLQEHRTEGCNYITISDIGSGINFKRKGINTLLEYCLQGVIGEVIVAHRDRLSRFGFELFKSIIIKAGGTLTVIDDNQNKSTEQELAEDLLSIVHIYSCRQMGKRSYSRKATTSRGGDPSNEVISN